MIKPHCFQKEWIESFRRQPAYERINPPLIEKMIHAFSLLQHLQTQELAFVFKGGTSLVLLLDKANRFSIDIDIITMASREEIEHRLDAIAASSVFTGWTLDARRSYQTGIPKAHYKLEYTSAYNKTGYVLLDILFERQHYPIVHALPVMSRWFETEKIVAVNVPSVESITGDKLTAFAPNTTGIPYGRTKELEIIKQLFDLAALFDRVQSVDIVASSFMAFARLEIDYRALNITPKDILWDAIHTCRIISFREGNKAEPDRAHYAELRQGIQQFASHLITGHFPIDEAIAASAKVAYLCIRLLIQDYTDLSRFDGQETAAFTITNPQWSLLNKLKRLPDPSAFSYWFSGLQLLGLAKAPA
jgi:Nucleotidyl transferase AbiEii toxin, Type IV TA system